jgi:hypothetical protein
MTTEVYNWHLSAEKKAELEAEARREGARYPRCLIVSPPIGPPNARTAIRTTMRNPAAIRRRALAAIGSVAGGDPTRSERASALVREIICRKHVKESNALARRFGRRTH